MRLSVAPSREFSCGPVSPTSRKVRELQSTYSALFAIEISENWANAFSFRGKG